MTLPYVPTVLPTPIVNPAVGSQGPPALPYISLSQFNYWPTALNGNNLLSQQAPTPQALIDTIRRASRWADAHCFGMDPSGNGASLAASLSIESANLRVRNGALRLICDYRPIVQVVGVDVGPNPAYVQSIGPVLASTMSIGRRTITVPLIDIPIRSGDVGSPATPMGSSGWVYAVWSYVYGYPHTALTADVAADDTTCVVQATDGNGGLFGVFPGLTSMLVSDEANTETVRITAVTPGSTTATLTTTPFANAHTLPATEGDFIPVSTIPDDVQQAVASLTSLLIKVRGSKAFVMPQAAGAAPDRKALAQAGAMDDWTNACRLLRPYRIRSKSKV